MPNRPVSERLSTTDVARYEATRYRGDQKLIDRREQRIVRALLARAAAGRRDLKAIDVPCGFGRFTPALLEVASWLVDADRSDAMAGRARDRALSLGAQAPGFGVADIRALPFATGAFDVVLSMRLLHHLHEKADRDAMFRELARISAKHVVISYYDRTTLHRWQRSLSGVFKPRRRKSKIFFFGTFKEEVEAAGMRVIAEDAPMPFLHAQRVALLEVRH